MSPATAYDVIAGRRMTSRVESVGEQARGVYRPLERPMQRMPALPTRDHHGQLDFLPSPLYQRLAPCTGHASQRLRPRLGHGVWFPGMAILYRRRRRIQDPYVRGICTFGGVGH